MSRISIAVVLALAVGLAATTAAAAAETPAVVRAVSVEGFGKAPVSPSASEAEANAAYRQAMASAIADGLNKAEFLAHGVGAGVGQVQSVGEAGGSISCTSSDGEYAEYTGGQADIGYAQTGGAFSASSAAQAVSPRGASSPKPGVKKKKKKKKKKKSKAIQKGRAAQEAPASSCTLTTNVLLVYALS